MIQIVCQFGSKRCLYLNQTNFNLLCKNIRIDFQDVPAIFQLMYIDEVAAEWMFIQNQKDLQKIIRLNKKYVLIKILPAVDRSQCCQPQHKIGKIQITQDLKQMIEFVSTKHIERYLQKRMTQKIMLSSNMMLQQKVPPSLTRFHSISSQIYKNMTKTKKRGVKVNRISPPKSFVKNSQRSQIQSAVICKFNKVFNQIVQESYRKIIEEKSCRQCSIKQLQLQKIINKQLFKKIKKYQNNPSQ